MDVDVTVADVQEDEIVVEEDAPGEADNSNEHEREEVEEEETVVEDKEDSDIIEDSGDENERTSIKSRSERYS